MLVRQSFDSTVNVSFVCLFVCSFFCFCFLEGGYVIAEQYYVHANVDGSVFLFKYKRVEKKTMYSEYDIVL